MRWKTGKKTDPKDGDTRNRYKFAWLPKVVDSGKHTVWLEQYISREKYYKDYLGYDTWQEESADSFDHYY